MEHPDRRGPRDQQDLLELTAQPDLRDQPDQQEQPGHKDHKAPRALREEAPTRPSSHPA